MPKNVNLNHFSMWRNEKKIIGLSPNSTYHVPITLAVKKDFSYSIERCRFRDSGLAVLRGPSMYTRTCPSILDFWNGLNTLTKFSVIPWY